MPVSQSPSTITAEGRKIHSFAASWNHDPSCICSMRSDRRYADCSTSPDARSTCTSH
jgi:hypothetical protein